jgi:cysteine synthase
MMELGIALHATAVLEQPRIVDRNAPQQRFHRPLDLGVWSRGRPVTLARSLEMSKRHSSESGILAGESTGAPGFEPRPLAERE